MAEPNFVHHTWTTEGDVADREGVRDAIGQAGSEQLMLRLEPRPLESQPPLRVAAKRESSTPTVPLLPEFLQSPPGQRQTQEALLSELLQLRSLTQEQMERIHNLEQALDQSLASLRQLQQQIVVQEFLETQLASTEEISNVQQQAIARLKLQLAQQQADLEMQLTQTQARDQSLQELLSTLEALTEAQQTELERLRSQIARDRGLVQADQTRLASQLVQLQTTFSTQQQRITELEAALAEQGLSGRLWNWLNEAQTHLQTLSAQSGLPQPALQSIEAALQQIRFALQSQTESPDSQLPQPLVSQPQAQELAVAQGKIEALETQIAKQLTTEAMLQQACQELEAERDRQQARMAELERQATDMQEQILRQAQQASEYETAVQHWKDRYVQHCQHIQQVQTLLDRALPHPPADLVALLATLQATPVGVEPSSPALLTTPTVTQGGQIDLPDFLLRRRNKARRS